ncbi:MAG: MBL fold metallo-hydrolase [Bacilli bacterium]
MKINFYKAKKLFAANTYVVSDGDICLVIDPGDDTGDFELFLKENNLKPTTILLTHGHFDHIRDLERLVKLFNCDIYIEEEDEKMLFSSKLNESLMFNKDVTFDDLKEKVIVFRDKEMLKFKDIEINVIHTPFHTNGSSCFYLSKNKILFSGDTLFKGDIGRTDLITSCGNKTQESLSKLMKLNDDIVVYPGHDAFTSIGYERKHNRNII